MASTSPTEQAAAVLESCLKGEPPPRELWRGLVAAAAGEGEPAVEASEALFQGVVEPLADRFDPPLCRRYAELFSEAIAYCVSGWEAADLLERYGSVRRGRWYRPDRGAPESVAVLSRVTLGADVAVTSIVLDAVKKRFPNARILFAGPRKCWELFAGDRRIEHLDAPYLRHGALRERLDAGLRLRPALESENLLVMDPDSRLSQLGLLPVCDEERYFFFESRCYGGESDDSLTQLTQRWCAEALGVVDAVPYIAPLEDAGAREAEGAITVSLGVGDNPAKRLPDPFEEELLKGLAGLGLPVVIDKGAGGDEAERVERAVAAAGGANGRIRVWEGAFAPFAARIAASRLYVGYDSAGQHVAAAARTPLISVFAGYPCERFVHRWRPTTTAPCRVLAVSGADWKLILDRVLETARQMLGIC